MQVFLHNVAFVSFTRGNESELNHKDTYINTLLQLSEQSILSNYPLFSAALHDILQVGLIKKDSVHPFKKSFPGNRVQQVSVK